MRPQSATASSLASPFHPRLSSHLHADNETCPWCEQDIPPEKLEEVSGKIAAKEREQTQAISAELEQQYAIDKAQADAKAKADLELERQQSAARETAAREDARQVAEAAAAQKLAEAERIRQEQQAGLQQQVDAAEAARKAVEQAGSALQAQLKQQLQDSVAALAAAKAGATAREALIRAQALSTAQADVAEKLAAAENACQQSEAALNEKIAEIEATRTAAEQQSAMLRAQLSELRQAKDTEVAKLKEDASAEAARIRQEATQAAEASMRDTLAEKDKAVTDAQAKSAAAEGKLAQLTEQNEVALKQQLDAQRDIMEKAKDDAVNAERAQAFEVNQKLQNKVTDLQRELEKKSADELGEGAELDLCDELKKQFQDDRIERIGKGKAGADILHTIMLNGKPCGTIIYDSKNHKQFRSEHVAKLKSDQLAAKADYAILSLHKFPEGTSQLHSRDGVLLANPARVVAAVILIRQHILQTHKLRLSSAQREEKTARLYAFITSERCAQFFSSVDTYTDGLLDHLVREKKWHDAAVKKRGETYRAIQKTMADLLTEISLIIGTANHEEPELEAAQP
jgi:hypothetical protein